MERVKMKLWAGGRIPQPVVRTPKPQGKGPYSKVINLTRFLVLATNYWNSWESDPLAGCLWFERNMQPGKSQPGRQRPVIA
jgi:hypothetical protein